MLRSYLFLRKSAFLLSGVVLCVGFCGCARFSQVDKPVTLRVMTYNIHHGEGMDGRVDTVRIAELIKQERVDIVALQEVDKGVRRTALRDLTAELASLAGMTGIFSNNFHYQGGEYGNAVMTRFPVKRWTNHHYQMLRPNEQRGILQLVLDVRGREVVFMNTHIDSRPDDAERWLNIGEIEELTKECGEKPVIVCGDFNNQSRGRVYERMTQTFQDTWTKVGQGNGFSFPANSVNRRIDYIWFTQPEVLKPLEAWLPKSEASDHLPLVAEFELR